MEELCADFARSTQLQVYNSTPFQLYLGVGGGVFAGERFLAYTCIGEIVGLPAYIWDLDHHDYLIVDDEYVLDVSLLSPRSILTWMREENQTDSLSNCVIRMEVNEKTQESRFFLWTTKRIDVDEELVYSSTDYLCC